jgi:hypothetical protein
MDNVNFTRLHPTNVLVYVPHTTIAVATVLGSIAGKAGTLRRGLAA